MNSMTGFGKAEATTRAGKLTVEISTVNSRYCEVSVRLPRSLSSLEHELREIVNGKISRGKVYIHVGLDETSNTATKHLINTKAARASYQQLVKLKKELGLEGEIHIRDLLLLPDITAPESDFIDNDIIWPGLKRATEKALAGMVKMRKREGQALNKDMSNRLKKIRQLLRDVKSLIAGFTDRHSKKLRGRINELLNGRTVDSTRLEEEIAIIVDKADISEECTRLASHLDQYRDTLKEKGPVGKKLNFVLQEMNRETNTIGSKSFEIEITKSVISIKEEIEKLREQVQNIE